MNITREQLPVEKFERLGLDKSRIDKMPQEEMRSLLSGFPSNMKFLSFRDQQGKEQKVNAKLSVYQTTDGQLDLKVHPYRSQIRNAMGLTEKELDALKSGSVISKTVHDGRQNQTHLVQLDRQTNEVRSIRTDQVRIVNAQGSTRLTPDQIEQLKAGKAIYVKDASGREQPLKLDLIRLKNHQEQTGLNTTQAQQNQKMATADDAGQHQKPMQGLRR